MKTIERTKPFWQRGMFLLVFLAVLFAAYFAFNYFSLSVIPETSGENNIIGDAPDTQISGLPLRLRIPNIGVDAPVEALGLTILGEMDAPETPEGTGWFKLGPRPGQKGSAVIAGHRGWRGGTSAVFDNLHKLLPGDRIYVEDNEGNTFVFVVLESRAYGARERVEEVWQRKDGVYLNLITCFGRWNRLTRTSDERLVVFTELIT